MNNTRKPISTRTRFEIFKRDGFTCQYCGAVPPAVILHVDHIIPVCDGGSNSRDNLTTSCQQCNLGKGPVSLSCIPDSLASRAAEIAEKEAQLRGYSKIMNAKIDRINGEVMQVAAVFLGSDQGSLDAQYLSSIRRFIEHKGVFVCLDAANIAVSRSNGYWSLNKVFKYFCGVMWSKIKEAK